MDKDTRKPPMENGFIPKLTKEQFEALQKVLKDLPSNSLKSSYNIPKGGLLPEPGYQDLTDIYKRIEKLERENKDLLDCVKYINYFISDTDPDSYWNSRISEVLRKFS